MNKILSFSTILSFGLLINLTTIKLVHAEPISTAAAIAFAIKKAEDEGLFDCGLHLGANQCRKLSRCNRARAVLKRAASGSETALKQLDSFIGASSMQRNCIRSLEGGHFSGLVENLEQLRRTEYKNLRTKTSYSKSRYAQYGIQITNSEEKHWDHHRSNVGQNKWEQDFHRSVVKTLFSQCHDPIGNDLQHWTNHSFNVSPARFVADVRKDWRCK